MKRQPGSKKWKLQTYLFLATNRLEGVRYKRARGGEKGIVQAGGLVVHMLLVLYREYGAGREAREENQG